VAEPAAAAPLEVELLQEPEAAPQPVPAAAGHADEEPAADAPLTVAARFDAFLQEPAALVNLVESLGDAEPFDFEAPPAETSSWMAAPVWEAPDEWEDERDQPEASPQPEVLSYPGLSLPEQPQQFAPLREPLLPAAAPLFDPAAVILQGRQSAAGDEMENQVDQSAEASLELLCFRVATEDYAISIMDIKEIIKPREVTEVPRVPDFVKGILSLRGIIIPVFDMRLRLGLAEGVHSERERIIVVKRLGGFVGVLVDQVVQVVRIAEEAVEAPPVVLEGIDREFIRGIGRVAGRMLILLDMEKVLDVSLL
jgi:purine-binding chemotaxis protein CheW